MGRKQREWEGDTEPAEFSSDSRGEVADHRSRRQRRRDDLARQRAALREQRRAEPASPLGVVAVILLLAIIVLGVGGGLPRLLGRGENDQHPVGVLTPGGGRTEAPAGNPSESAASPSVTDATLSTPPVLTQRPGTVAIEAAEHAVRSWASLFYTRSPGTETYQQLIDRARQYTTAELADSFSDAGDTTYEALKADNGSSRVVTVTVAKPRPGTAPVDLPTRVTRLVTIKVATSGKNARQFDVPVMATIVVDGDRWLVAAVDGGVGP